MFFDSMIPWAPWLIAMAVLILLSGFFSASEAALFYLGLQDRLAMSEGNRAQRLAVSLLDQPDRLLTAVLFWNLTVNLGYFAVTSIVGIGLGQSGGEAAAIAFSVVALLAIIFFSEMLPKSLAVLNASAVAALVAAPMAVATRIVDPLIPVFRTVNLLSRRLLWPTFTSEPYLDVADLERAVEASTTDADLLKQEQAALQNIVSLSYLRIDEVMRPRTRLRLFRPPVTLADLRGETPPPDYLLITEPDNDEMAGAVPLDQMPDVPQQHLEHYAEDLLYVPWCATAANVLEQMQRRDRRVAAVVNEFGETVGAVTIDDLLDTIFAEEPSRTWRLLDRAPIQQVSINQWHVAGMTNLRRLARYFDIELPKGYSVTMSGALQEMLERVPEPGDRCRWGPFEVEVLSVPERGQLLVQLTRMPDDRPAGEEAMP